MCHRWYIRCPAGRKESRAQFYTKGSMWYESFRNTYEMDRPVKEGSIRPKERAEPFSDLRHFSTAGERGARL